MKWNVFVLLICFLFFAQTVIAQSPPFWDEIQAFKKTDLQQPPPKNAIVFVGSSSFEKWKDVQNYFPGYTIINRGFGGSTLPDVIRYTNDIIIPYQPKQVVIYCGDNDLASSNSVSAQLVYDRFRQLYYAIRKNLPKTSIVFVSIKPSPSRKNLMPKMEEANRLIQQFLSKQQHAGFIDVYHKMLTPEGKPIASLFLEDELHMNAKGYAIWQKAIQPYLLK